MGKRIEGGGAGNPKCKAGEPQVEAAAALTATFNALESETTYWNNKAVCKEEGRAEKMCPWNRPFRDRPRRDYEVITRKITAPNCKVTTCRNLDKAFKEKQIPPFSRVPQKRNPPKGTLPWPSSAIFTFQPQRSQTASLQWGQLLLPRTMIKNLGTHS